jgi:hypothetical protein
VLKVQQHFQDMGVETYVPMHEVYKEVEGNRKGKGLQKIMIS